MEWTPIIVALITVLGGGGLAGLYKWAKSQGAAEEIARQAAETVKTLTAENGQLRSDLTAEKAENARLWQLVETTRQGRQL